VTKKEITNLIKEKIILAAASFMGKRRVTQALIARKAGVCESQITDYMAKYPEVKIAIAEVKRPSAKERILLAIKHFKDRGLRTTRKQIREMAKVGTRNVWYWSVHSALVRRGLEEVRLLSTREKILMAIEELRKEGRCLTRKAIRLRARVSETAYSVNKRRWPEIRAQLKIGPIPLSVEQRILDAIRNLSDLNRPVTRKMVALKAGIDLRTLSVHENKPDGLVKKSVAEVLPLSTDQKIALALHRLVLKGQFPNTINIAKEAGLCVDTVLKRMRANVGLGLRIKKAAKTYTAESE